jgi:hypothetical protein
MAPGRDVIEKRTLILDVQLKGQYIQPSFELAIAQKIFESWNSANNFQFCIRW